MIRLGYALCGSFCTFSRALDALRSLKESYEITPIFSEYASATDTRFYQIEDYIRKAEDICGHTAIRTIREAEPIGPQRLFDVLAVAPCTGNTLGKLGSGVTDSTVTMAVKAHLRNERPVVLGISTNDALGASAVSIGSLLNRRHVYFVPFGQDDPQQKPRSLVCDFTKIGAAVDAALQGRQIQPILL